MSLHHAAGSAPKSLGCVMPYPHVYGSSRAPYPRLFRAMFSQESGPIPGVGLSGTDYNARAGGFGRDAAPSLRTRQNVAERDLVRGARPWTKLAQFSPAVDNAGVLVLNRPMAEPALVEVDDRLGDASGLLHRTRPVP